MSEITKKQLSQADLQTGSDIVVLQDHALTLDASDGGKVKRILHSQLKATYLEGYTIGGGGQKAILTDDAEQTVTNKTLDGCVFKDCTVADGDGTPPLIEFIEGKVTESVDEAMGDVSSGRTGFGTLFMAEGDLGVPVIPAAEILADAGLTGYCIPVQNILALYVADAEGGRIEFGVTAIEYETAYIMDAGGNKIEVPIISAIGSPSEGKTLYLRYIPAAMISLGA